jgi:hypothetical protein
MTDNSTEPKIRSGQTWAAPMVSLCVFAVFGYGMWLVFHPTGTEVTDTQRGIIEALKQLPIAVVMYWLGSSAGSERKTEMIFHSTPAAMPPGTTTTTIAPDPQP